ncbi:unnamed protein product, partial [Prorocentrum cordatum]
MGFEGGRARVAGADQVRQGDGGRPARPRRVAGGRGGAARRGRGGGPGGGRADCGPRPGGSGGGVQGRAARDLLVDDSAMAAVENTSEFWALRAKEVAAEAASLHAMLGGYEPVAAAGE